MIWKESPVHKLHGSIVRSPVLARFKLTCIRRVAWCTIAIVTNPATLAFFRFVCPGISIQRHCEDACGANSLQPFRSKSRFLSDFFGLLQPFAVPVGTILQKSSFANRSKKPDPLFENLVGNPFLQQWFDDEVCES